MLTDTWLHSPFVLPHLPPCPLPLSEPSFWKVRLNYQMKTCKTQTSEIHSQIHCLTEVQKSTFWHSKRQHKTGKQHGHIYTNRLKQRLGETIRCRKVRLICSICAQIQGPNGTKNSKRLRLAATPIASDFVFHLLLHHVYLCWHCAYQIVLLFCFQQHSLFHNLRDETISYLHVSLVSSISLSSSLLFRTAPILSALSAPNFV